MTEHELELRLQALACALDRDAPVLDVAVLRADRPRRMRRRVAAAIAVVTLVTASVAVPALRGVFEVEHVSELEALPAEVAPAHVGRPAPLGAARGLVGFPVATVRSLDPPSTVHVRDDFDGGAVTLTYDGVLLTQWPSSGVRARISVVPAAGRAEEVSVGALSALWVAGAARGILTVVGADGAVHREVFDVAEGVLLWEEDGISFLLQGEPNRERALELATTVGP